MSVNHFSSDFPQTLWWPQLQQHEIMESLSKSTSSPSSPSPSPAATNFWPNSQFFNTIKNSTQGFDLNNNEEEDEEIHTGEEISRDHNSKLVVQDIGHNELIPKLALFEKPLTPSDVGKLNRLVIPKQHAEKHFPINGGVNESGEKGGLLLSFEDELGKPWRFRYSYWNSSQSYVLTKGWSRFVKEKKLDAGDIVQFQRHPIDSERMFIGWKKRRSDDVGGGILQSQPAVIVASSSGGWRPYPVQVQVQPPHHHGHGPALPYPPDSFFHAGGGGGGGRNGEKCSKRGGGGGVLRLFGVNMECGSGQLQGEDCGGAPISDDSGSPSAASSSNQGPDPAYYHNRYHFYHANYDHTTHADVNFPRDMTRYQQG